MPVRKFSKLIATVAALALGLSFSLTAIAAPSPSTTNSGNGGSGFDVSAYITATNEDVPASAVSEDIWEEARAAAKKLFGDDAQVIKVFSLTKDLNGDTDITIVTSVLNPGQNIAILHKKADGTWESIRVVELLNGKTTGTFKSLSPVAIVVKGKIAPKTGVTVAVTGLLSLVALFGAAVCFKKFKA
ncbi:MAG: hypothetical protein J6X80_05850 [Lachnospiraceae bacterium]|nr:hypothetical protein [Lachnospiraceae bacterium]